MNTPIFRIYEQNFQLGDICYNAQSGKVNIVDEKIMERLDFCKAFAYGCSYYRKVELSVIQEFAPNLTMENIKADICILLPHILEEINKKEL